MNIHEIEKRKKALFPTLFMSAEERANFKATMASQVVGSNTLGGSNAPLWEIISPEAIDATAKKYFDLSRTTHVVEGYIPAAPGVRPVVNVEVITNAGGALKNATNWNQSAMQNKYVQVTMDRFSCPFGLSSYDIMNGERLQTKIGAAIEAVVARVVNTFFGKVQASLSSPSNSSLPSISNGGNLDISGTTFGPEFVAGRLSAIFGGYGPVDDLVLDPVLWAKLVPTNALGLGTEPGSYGIEYLHRTAGLNMPAPTTGWTSTANVYGYALRKNAVASAFGLPYYDDLTGIATQDLGRVAGIPLLLKTWTDKSSEVLYSSVETLAGFSVANPLSICGLYSEASPAAGGEGTDPSGD